MNLTPDVMSGCLFSVALKSLFHEMARGTMQIFVALFTLSSVSAQVIWTGNPSADAFITNGTLNGVSPTTNYGGLGAISVAGANSENGGQYLALLKFDLAGVVAAFDAGYGPGNWTISSVTLRLAGNFATQGAVPNNARFPTINGGAFSMDWFADDSWTETGVTYANFLSGATSSLGGFTYVPPGNNVQVSWSLGLPAAFTGDIASGGNVSVMLAPGDSTVSYLFNSRSYNTAANFPLLTVTAFPEPSVVAMVLGGAALAIGARRRRV